MSRSVRPPTTATKPTSPQPLVDELLGWYATAARELPWRRRNGNSPTPWAVLVSEVMLQQTPVRRVLPAFDRWMARWPTPAALAAATPGDAVRAWDRLGYPRRALWLHAAATRIVACHGGHVPADYSALRSLPGLGEYTAAAVAAFAFGQRHAVLDTNVRRVLARAVSGIGGPPPSTSVAERAAALRLLPDDAELAATFSAALMELGAVVCRAQRPGCDTCPIADRCAWRKAGYPAGVIRGRRGPAYEGSDRQARGAVLEVLRSKSEAVGRAELRTSCESEAQFARALNGLVADGLVEPIADDRFGLPG